MSNINKKEGRERKASGKSLYPEAIIVDHQNPTSGIGSSVNDPSKIHHFPNKITSDVRISFSFPLNINTARTYVLIFFHE